MTPSISAEDEAVELAADLIRIDTTNTGDPATVVGEREAAEYVAAKLTEVGYEIEMVESGAPRRDNVFARLPGAPPFNSASNSSSGASRAALISRSNPISRCTRGSGFRRRSSSV